MYQSSFKNRGQTWGQIWVKMGSKCGFKNDPSALPGFSLPDAGGGGREKGGRAKQVGETSSRVGGRALPG